MSFFNTISKNDVVFLTPLIVATAPLSLPYIANATPRNATEHGKGEGEMQSFSFDKIMWQKGIKPPPLCFAPQNIGEVSERRKG